MCSTYLFGNTVGGEVYSTMMYNMQRMGDEMASNEGPEGKRGRAARGGAKAPAAGEMRGAPVTGKVLAAFRIPRALHSTMTQESRAEGLDLTAYVNRLFDGFLHYFGLPSIVREGLEADRDALGFGRYEYLQYVLYRRHEAVAQQGPAFDRAPKRK